MQERLQKILSARGLASRRKAEELIEAGLVLVNGTPAMLGQKADPSADVIEVKGGSVAAHQTLLYFLFCKPVGILTSSQVRREQDTVACLLPPKLRGLVHPVGRLDKDSEGLLLLTNDGTLAYRLTHPKFDHEKEYAVTTAEPLTDAQLSRMARGMTILGERTKPAVVKRTGTKKFSIALTEGKNRQIRRMVEKAGGTVISLRRTRIVTLRDPLLQPGQLRKLSDEEVRSIRLAVGL